MDSYKIPTREILILTLGEAVAGAIICAVYLLIGKFDYTVPLGALLGGAVTVLNFLFLCISVNRAIDDAMKNYNAYAETKAEKLKAEPTDSEENEDGESDSEEETYDDAAAKFARENAEKISNAAKLSYIVRTATVIISLVVAFLTKQFNVIATVIPLLLLRPILTVSELIKRKGKVK